MSDRINKLQQYMDFFNKTGANVNINPESSIYNGKRALDWATQQLSSDSLQQAMQPRQMPDYFTNQLQNPAYQQQEMRPNPYTPNAMETGDMVTNYLKRYLQPQRTGSMTLGIRG